MEYLDLADIKIQHVKTLMQIFKCLVAIARITPLHIDLSYIDLILYSVRRTSICYLSYKLSVIVFCPTFFTLQTYVKSNWHCALNELRF